MVRLKREESQALTRSKLLASALRLFARNGYICTSVEHIAEEAGFSKGAFYSNFDGKEQIYLEILESYGADNLTRLLTALDGVSGIPCVIDVLADWSTETSRAGNWAMLVMEYGRNTRRGEGVWEKQEEIFRAHWRVLGERLLPLLGIAGVEPDHLGALIFELTYAPAMSFVKCPTAGDLVRLALKGMLDDGSNS